MDAQAVLISGPDNRVLQVVQGQIGPPAGADVIYTAIVGACVVVCLYDPVVNQGGLAHFVFPNGDVAGPHDPRFGHQALSALMSNIVGCGGSTARMQASLFGGAKLHDGRRDIGRRNAEFAVRFLGQHNIRIVTRSLGGQRVRRVSFSPSSGACSEVPLVYGAVAENISPNDFETHLRP